MGVPYKILELRSVRGSGGGPEKTILYGAHRTDVLKYNITACYLRDLRDHNFGPARKAKEVPIDYVEIVERNSLDPCILPKLRKLVIDRHIDIIHAHDYKTNLLALLLSRCEKVIALSTAHGWTGHTARERFYYRADKWLLRKFPRIIAVSSEIRDELVKSGCDHARIDVILNGIDSEVFKRDRSKKQEALLELNLPADRIVFGAVGRLEPQKRFDLLLQAFDILRRDHPNIFLAIAGEGSSRPLLESEIRRLCLQDSCRLLGHQADVIRVHNAIDLFVQSSKYEGTPNAVLEAMAMESPIVATAAGGTAELVRDGVDGLIVPSNDAIALREAMRNLLSDPMGAARRAASARRRVENELSFDCRMRKVEKVYDQLIQEYGRNRRPAAAHA